MIVVTVSLHLQPRAAQVAVELEQAMNTPGEDLGPAALAIAKVEYPSLEAAPYLELLDRMGEEASTRIGAARTVSIRRRGARVQRVLLRRTGVQR